MHFIFPYCNLDLKQQERERRKKAEFLFLFICIHNNSHIRVPSISFICCWIYIHWDHIASNRMRNRMHTEQKKRSCSLFLFGDSANVLFPFDCLYFVSSLTFNLCLYLNTEEANDLTVRFKWKGKRYLIRVINDLVNLHIEKSRKEIKKTLHLRNGRASSGVIQKSKGKDEKK